MQTLELRTEVTGETCVNRIRAMQETYVPDEDYRHRICSGLNKSCPDYRPVHIFEIPITAIRFG